MANVYYENFFLSNEIEDQLNTRLDLQRFAKIDNNLVGEPGMTRKINVYSATSGVEILGIGEGNTKSIEVSFTPKTYVIETAQARFQYFDEQAMADPMVVPVGMGRIASDMMNQINDDVIRELSETTHTITATGNAYATFDNFADAVAEMNLETQDDIYLYALIAPADVATLRKNLLNTLQYVEAYARQGYIGTVAGVNVFACKALTAGSFIIAANDAVTIFNKTGVDVEQVVNGTRSETAANIRQNTIFGRKYYIAALTNADHAVLIESE